MTSDENGQLDDGHPEADERDRDLRRLGGLAAWACANGIRPGICRPVSATMLSTCLRRLSKASNLRDHLGRLMEDDEDLARGVRIRITVDLG